MDFYLTVQMIFNLKTELNRIANTPKFYIIIKDPIISLLSNTQPVASHHKPIENCRFLGHGQSN